MNAAANNLKKLVNAHRFFAVGFEERLLFDKPLHGVAALRCCFAPDLRNEFRLVKGYFHKCVRNWISAHYCALRAGRESNPTAARFGGFHTPYAHLASGRLITAHHVKENLRPPHRLRLNAAQYAHGHGFCRPDLDQRQFLPHERQHLPDWRQKIRMNEFCRH